LSPPPFVSFDFVGFFSGIIFNWIQAFPEIAPALPPKEVPKIAPPIKRFMDLPSPGDMKLAEVVELLKDYRRLANHLKELGAFETTAPAK
jgi:hypothetical protein